MNSSKSLRIFVSGALLVLAVGALHRWFSIPRHPAAAITSVETNEPEVVAVRNKPTPVRPRERLPRLLARTNAPAPAPLPTSPQQLFVEWKGRWYPAEILAAANGSNYIRYAGYGPEWDEWVTPERMRYSEGNSLAVTWENPPAEVSPDTQPAEPVRMTPLPGDLVAFHGNRWWRAEVLQTQGDQSFIRYVGYGAEWDEWVGPDRFKVYSEEDARNNAPTATLPETTALPGAAAAPLVQGSPAKGDLLVEWGKQWWPAEILKQEGVGYLIRYKGYGSQWDEWVTIERLGTYSGSE